MGAIASEQGQSFDEIPTLEGMEFPDGLGLVNPHSGKVRDVFDTPAGDLLLAATDRLSAFDQVIGYIPGRGQVLNQLSAWWFDQMKDIIPNHVIDVPDPNVTVAKKLTRIPVEVIVRSVITGVTGTSLYFNYQNAEPDADGYRVVYGIKFPPGLKKNDILSEPIITPTTKADAGAHDEKLTEKEIVERGIVTPAVWDKVRTAAINMFTRAQKIARDRGFLLVDTKMEFGMDEKGNVYVMDELFTPDSSRYWWIKTMEERLAAGQEPDNYDKEYLRLAYKAMGYGGEGNIPDDVPLDIKKELLRRYVAVYESLTGNTFQIPHGDVALRIRANVAQYLTQELLQSRELERRDPHVVIIMGSESDLEHSQKISGALAQFGISTELRVGSAHKNPENVLEMVQQYDAMEHTQTVYIAVAGRSNALGGMIAGATTNLVINCPPKGEWYDIFSSLRMPSGVAAPVVIEPESAALAAVQVFAGTRPDLAKKLADHQESMREKIIAADQSLGTQG